MSADVILAQIRALYRQLEALPRSERPDAGWVHRPSDRYLVLEAQIRDYATLYKTLYTDDDAAVARRVNPGEVETETPRRRCG